MNEADVIAFPGYVAVIAVVFLALAVWCALAAFVVQAIADRFSRTR